MSPSSLQAELQQICVVVEELTGLPSRWNGSIELMSQAEIALVRGRSVFAEKLWGCSILVNADIADLPIRWRSFLHELLHSVSVGANDQDYKRFRGWEEAAVEQLQRHLRPVILSRLEVTVPESLFTDLEAHWLYNRYIEATETLRMYLSMDVFAFYHGLLQTPLADRPAYARSLDASTDYLRLFAQASGKLRG